MCPQHNYNYLPLLSPSLLAFEPFCKNVFDQTKKTTPPPHHELQPQQSLFTLAHTVGIIAICISVTIDTFSSKVWAFFDTTELFASDPRLATKRGITLDSLLKSYYALEHDQVPGLDRNLRKVVLSILPLAIASSKSVNSEKDVEMHKKELEKYKQKLENRKKEVKKCYGWFNTHCNQ